jgi:hypothetical protein
MPSPAFATRHFSRISGSLPPALAARAAQHGRERTIAAVEEIDLPTTTRQAVEVLDEVERAVALHEALAVGTQLVEEHGRFGEGDYFRGRHFLTTDGKKKQRPAEPAGPTGQDSRGNRHHGRLP